MLAFFLSGKGRVGWLVFALVFFIIDTVVMFGYYGISPDMIIDYAFHAAVIVFLAIGIKANRKLESLPPEELVAPIVDVPEEVNE